MMTMKCTLYDDSTVIVCFSEAEARILHLHHSGAIPIGCMFSLNCKFLKEKNLF